MKYKKLGRTDLEVSEICLGTMTWGKQNTEAEGHAQMDYALEKGVNFWDTAEMYAIPPTAETYGKTEEIIGTWFANNKAKRKDVVLATKIAGVGLSWVRDGNNRIDRKNVLAAVEDSLKRLQTDYIDLYQLHWPNRGSYHFGQHWEYAPQFDKIKIEDNMVEVLETLKELIADGKIRHVGLSDETAWGITRWTNLADKLDLPRMASIQNEYSLLCRLAETDVQEACAAEDVSFLPWSPLAMGMLSGKYLDGARPAGTRWTLMDNPPRDTQLGQDAVRAYMDVAKKHGLDVCQMALAFVNSRPFVTSNIIGATNMEQLKSNISSVEVKLNKECLKDISDIYHRFPAPF